jgi:hypothetical protein
MSRAARALGCFAFAVVAFWLCVPEPGRLSAQPKPAPPAVPATFPSLTTPANLGLQRGSSTELVLSGTNLLDATGVWFSGPGKVTIPEGQKDATKLKVKVDVPAGAAIGQYAMRVATKAGISNLKSICIDEVPEIAEKDGNTKRETPQVVTAPCAITGGVVAETTDYFKFSAKAGETICVEAIARRLGSSLDPVIILYDGTGREIPGLYADDTPGLQSDARVTHTFTSTTEVIVAIRDTTYRGGADFTYRLRIGNGPSATTAFPLFVQAGKTTPVGFSGPDAVGAKPVPVTPKPDHTVAYVAPKRDSGISGWPVPVRVSDIPESVEQEPNGDIAKANRVPVPGGVSARFTEKNDVDVFQFPGKKGQKLVIQALTYEVNSPAEVYLRVQDKKGTELGKSNPQQATPRIEFSPTTDDDFFVVCEHTNFASGPNEVYHLSIRPAAPDFSVAVGLDRIDVPVSGAGLLPITGITKLNGYAGPIEVSFDGADGLSGKVTLPATANPQPNAPIFLPISAKAGTKLGPIIGTLKATAKIDGADVVRAGNLFESIRLALGSMPNPPLEATTQVAIAVTPEPLFSLTLTLEKTEVSKGGMLKGKIAAKRSSGFAEDIQIAAATLPATAVPTLKPIPKAATEADVSITVPASVPAGAGVVVLRGTAKVGGKDVSVVALPVAITVLDAKK